MMQPTMIDLFAGCGGVTLGFKNKGYQVLAAVENDPTAAKTYHANHPEVVLYAEDIREVSPQAIMERCNLKPGQLTVLCACPPCQPFSSHNRRMEHDERAWLVLELVRFAKDLRPQFLFFENVPGILRSGIIFNQLLSGLEGLGYRVSEPAIVNAVDYGVPQFRKRLILLATSYTNVSLGIPEPTHAHPWKASLLGKKPWLTVRDAFAGLADLESGEACEFDPLHKARKHSPINLERIRHVPKNGGSRDSIPDEMQLSCHRKNANCGYQDVYGRMSFDKPANTLTTGCTNFTKGRYAHPVSDRSITLREAARLQTFPDSYLFFGNYEQISRQIGNAVPVRLAEAFAEHLRNIWQTMTLLPTHPTEELVFHHYPTQIRLF